MLNLGAELSNRLVAEGFKGRHLTVKVMTRHPDAPVNPPKFLGHGPCDTHTKTWTLQVATDSAETIGELAWKLLRSLELDPKELRGLALQMQKLEGEGAASDMDREQGQSLLTFSPKKASSATTSRQMASPTKSVPAEITIDDDDDTPAKVPSRVQPARGVKSRAVIELPTASQIDLTVFDELPDEVKAELPYARDARGRLLSSSKPKQPAKSSLQQTTIAGSIASTKPFTEQAKLKKRGQIGLRATVPRGDFPPSPTRITDEQLQTMKMDVDAFRGLPRDIQIEVLSDAWNKMEKPWRLAQKQQAAAAGRRSRSVSAKPVDSHPEAVAVHQMPKIFGRVDLDEIRDRLDIWMEAKADEGPFEGDVDHLAAGILATLDRTRGQDLAKAAAVLSWWKLLIGQRFGPEGGRKSLAAEWNEAFESVRARVDDVVRLEYGGVLSLV
jgi:DNA repair protein REV1